MDVSDLLATAAAVGGFGSAAAMYFHKQWKGGLEEYQTREIDALSKINERLQGENQGLTEANEAYKNQLSALSDLPKLVKKLEKAVEKLGE